ncbi:ASCH domain-containing protein [Nesterenkonia flava]|uniref:ASCH domain-containing protein n=1 Tax=Nesterenkonia flava TaxID=469799 RepID=A0ABU1FTJ3_9MICC|nr:ASCH domain-containing protein [Nesterenkonia flava]MDR5711923.1 ASCH domain-containing protein [Nesterenkonia flava]
MPALSPQPLAAPDHSAAHALWSAYAAAEPLAAAAAPDYLVDQFGDHRELADELLGLVAAGVKTGTASLLAEYVWEGEVPPGIGSHTIFCSGDGAPRVVVRTVGLRICRFDEVTSEFAYTEGEGDRSLAHWRHEHQVFWERVTQAAGRSFSPDMEVLCENFVKVWPPEGISDPG